MYLTCLLNHNFMMIMCVINVILSLKFFKIILCSNFYIFRYYFHTYFMSIMFINLHLLLIKTCILTHFFELYFISQIEKYMISIIIINIKKV